MHVGTLTVWMNVARWPLSGRLACWILAASLCTPCASAQHWLEAEERAALLQRGLDQLPAGKEHVAPVLVAGWGTLEQVREVVAEVGWNYQVRFDHFKLQDTFAEEDIQWDPLSIPQLATTPGILRTERDGETRTTRAYALWEFMLCQNTAETNLTLLRELPWQRWAKRHGETPVAVAAAEGDVDLVLWLIEQGGDTRAESEDFELTALHNAVMWREPDDALRLIDALVKSGAEIDARDRFEVTPLIGGAYYECDARVMRRLLELGADPKAASRRGETALHFAADHGDVAQVRLLLELGADPQARTTHGWTPVDYARESGRGEVIDLLDN